MRYFIIISLLFLSTFAKAQIRTLDSMGLCHYSIIPHAVDGKTATYISTFTFGVMNRYATMHYCLMTDARDTVAEDFINVRLSQLAITPDEEKNIVSGIGAGYNVTFKTP